MARMARLLIVLLVAAGAAVAVPGAASAAYFFRPGEPTMYGFAGNTVDFCTGGYAIRGTDGLFLLTAGHCAQLNAAVYGQDARFGTVAHTKYPADDTALIKLTAPNDAYQIVVDPLTGRTPGGSGKVVGVLSSTQFKNGFLVGKMGYATGWTEGKIYAESAWHGKVAFCARMRGNYGDSGGPVWRTAPGGGVYALGIVVAGDPGNDGTCFYPISRLLQGWGAQLPTFPSGAAALREEPPAEAAAPLAYVDPSELRPL